MAFRLFEHPPNSPVVKGAILATKALAAVLVATGVLALIGAVTGIEALAAPIAGWRPMLPMSALASTGLGIALWGRIYNRPSLAALGAVPALAVGLAGLLGFFIRFELPWGGQPMPSAALVITAAVGLLIGSNRAHRGLGQMTLGMAGLALVALSVTIAFARAVGIFGTRVGTLPATSFQLTVTMLLLGLCFISLVWVSDPKDLEPPAWLPVATGLASLIAVMSLWNALAERERELALEASRQAAVSEERLLRRDLEGSAGSIVRAAEWAAAGVPIELQERDLRALRRDIPGLEGLFRLTVDGSQLTAVPDTANSATVVALWRKYLSELQGPIASKVFLPLDSAANRFVVFAPVCDGRCDGVVAAVMQSSVVFRATLLDTLSGFRFAITGPAGVIEGSHQPPPLPTLADRDRPLRVGSVEWAMTTWPREEHASNQNLLPGTVLFMGLVLTLLLPLTLHLGRSAWIGAQDRERARLAFALDRATDGIWELHVPTGETIRSPALLKNLQYVPEAAPTNLEGWSSLIHPDDRPLVTESLARHVAGESDTFEVEYRVRAADGTWHTVVDRGRIVDRSPLGSPARILGISADVTEARALAEARDASERRFRTVFNSGFQFEILLTADCRVLEVNQVALDHTGATADQVINQECWNTLWWSDNPAAQEVLRTACAAAKSGQTETWHQEIRLGDRRMTLEVSIKPVNDPDGKPSQLLLEARDVTERLRAEAALTEVASLTTMGRIAARVAHEINNPLAGIQNAFLLIKDAVPANHPHFAYVGAIEREISRISNVTRQLYETYRPEHDATGISSVQLVAADAVSFLEQVNRSRTVSIVTDFAGVQGPVPVSAAILRQVFYNLVQNAIDASPPGGTVTITAAATPATLSIQVRDQGPGVPESLRDRIFDPFFSTKEKDMDTSGMGIGLALVRRSVEAASGSITLETPVAGGAEFVVRLPLRPSGKMEAIR